MATIRQTVVIDAAPGRVYQALMDSRSHAAFTEAKASVARVVGGKVSAYDGQLQAINVELISGKRIVQAWRATDWPKGAWSIARFELKAAAGGKTRLVFEQEGVPASKRASIDAGWRTYYWQPLNAFLKS